MDEERDSDPYEDEREDEEPPAAVSLTDRKMEQQYESGRLRVVQDRNDFFLQNVVDFAKDKSWGNLRPEYQRRLRWSNEKKSRLIESFLMNVPVPPVFLYEDKTGVFEVMDGQQRINAIFEFMENKFQLEKLKIWSNLNGRNFAGIPPALRRGLKRAKLSAIALITDEEYSRSSDVDVRAQVFDRLNTGGEKLNPQELRNCLYSGSFNRLIARLAARSDFTKAWEIPSHKRHKLSDGSYDNILKNNKLFSAMVDCQIVLRYFAFREDNFLRGSVKSMLDNTMKRLRHADKDMIESLESDFVETLRLTLKIFGSYAFRVDDDGEPGRLSKPLFDAEMIAVDGLRDHADQLIAHRQDIIRRVAALTRPGHKAYAVVVGRPNTADAIRRRIASVRSVLVRAIR